MAESKTEDKTGKKPARIRVSVALASYNGETYIRQQLDSILPQLDARDEIVISDDGSTDRTIDIINMIGFPGYQARDSKPRIRLIPGPRRGIKQNIANALAHTEGTYIFLADQDDVWKPDKVRRVLQVFKEHKCHVVVHDCIVTDEHLDKVIYPSFFAYRGCGAGMWSNIWKNKYIGCCMALHRDLKPYILPIPDDIQMHDQWIGVINDKHRGGTIFLKEPLLYYRRHGSNVSDFGRNTVPVMIRNRLLFLWRLAGR